MDRVEEHLEDVKDEEFVLEFAAIVDKIETLE